MRHVRAACVRREQPSDPPRVDAVARLARAPREIPDDWHSAARCRPLARASVATRRASRARFAKAWPTISTASPVRAPARRSRRTRESSPSATRRHQHHRGKRHLVASGAAAQSLRDEDPLRHRPRRARSASRGASRFMRHQSFGALARDPGGVAVAGQQGSPRLVAPSNTAASVSA